jgi:hypothetical protein
MLKIPILPAKAASLALEAIPGDRLPSAFQRLGFGLTIRGEVIQTRHVRHPDAILRVPLFPCLDGGAV